MKFMIYKILIFYLKSGQSDKITFLLAHTQNLTAPKSNKLPGQLSFIMFICATVKHCIITKA